jgi:RNA polymerase sigma-70 factor (ECF subfamily)
MSKEGENYSSKSDEELMLAYQEDDSLAFNELYDRTADRIQGYLQRRVQDKTLVDDILQGTYFKFHQTRSQYRPPLPVLPWLFTICQSVMIDTLRARERHLKRIEDIEPSTLAVEVDKDKVPAGLEPALLDGVAGIRNLSTHQKQALELRFGNDLSFEEIARRLETSPSNVRQMVSRGLRRLKLVAERARGGK